MVTTSVHLDIITTNDSAHWQQAIDEVGKYDTYHLPKYNKLAETHEEGSAKLLVYRENNHIIAFPMLLRDINLPSSVGANGIKDTTSAYGYGGPIASPNIPESVRLHFTEALNDFYKSENVIAAFSRLHPIIENEWLLDGYGETIQFGITVSVDLTLPPEVQYANYRRCHKQSVQRLLERGLTCTKVGKERLGDFLLVYYETMDRNEADPYYYFDRGYLEYLLDDMQDNTCLIICEDGQTAISCCLSLCCNGIVQGHIGGTLNRYLPLAPMKLVLDTVRRWANDIGAHTLNLGGGVGGQQDSILAFKQGFSKRQSPCSIWRNVINNKIYEELYREICRTTGLEPESDYFPLYRHPAFSTVCTSHTADAKPVAAI